MKLRHFAAVLSFLTAFGLSVLLIGLPVGAIRSTPTPCKEKQPPVVSSETEMQTRIRQFLEADRQTGIELANDMARLSQSDGQIKAEKIATTNLVEKMKKVKCDDLPDEFCNAWDAHLVAWSYKAFLLDRYLKNGPSDYRIANEQINNSYQKMLMGARRHGVDFKY